MAPVAFAMKWMRGSKVLLGLPHKVAQGCSEGTLRVIHVSGFTWVSLVGGVRTKAEGTLRVPGALNALGYRFDHQCPLWADGFHHYRYVGPLE